MTAIPLEDHELDADAGTEHLDPTIPEDLRRTVGYFAHALNQRLTVVMGRIDLALDGGRPLDVASATSDLGFILAKLAEISLSFATRINAVAHNDVHAALTSIAHRAMGFIQRSKELVQLDQLEAWAEGVTPLARELRGIECRLPGELFNARTVTAQEQALANSFGLDANGNPRP